MGAKKDLTGLIFGRTTVLRYSHTAGNKRWWVCACICGVEATVRGSELTRSRRNTTSCGCARVDAISTHGLTGTPTYRTWRSMHTRCTAWHKSHRHYFDKGITVCERWSSFENFLADMGPRPEGRTLERRDNNAGYSPDNCRWATPTEQGRNQSSNRKLTAAGITMTASEWTERLGCAKSTIRERIERGWSPEDACTRPVRRVAPPRSGGA